MTKLEEVARAIYESHSFVRPWEHRDTARIWHEWCKNEARFVLNAIREPNAAMTEAGDMESYMGHQPCAYGIWQAMLDVILNEKETT